MTSKTLLLIDALWALKKLTPMYGDQCFNHAPDIHCGPPVMLLRYALDMINRYKSENLEVLFVLDQPNDQGEYARHALLEGHGTKYKLPYTRQAIGERLTGYIDLINMWSAMFFPARAIHVHPGLEARDLIADTVSRLNSYGYDRAIICGDPLHYYSLLASNGVRLTGVLEAYSGRHKLLDLSDYRKEFPHIPVRDYALWRALSNTSDYSIEFKGVGKAKAMRAVNSPSLLLELIAQQGGYDRLHVAKADHSIPYIPSNITGFQWKGLGGVQSTSIQVFVVLLYNANTGMDKIPSYQRILEQYRNRFSPV